LSISFSGCFEDSKKKEKDDEETIKGYTLFEMLEKYDQTIENLTLSNNVSISNVVMREHISNGHFLGFTITMHDYNSPFIYSPPHISMNCTGAYISIQNGEIIEIEVDNSSRREMWMTELKIEKLNIDSDEAYSIAINNPSIKQFLKNGEKYNVRVRRALICEYERVINYQYFWIYYDNVDDNGRETHISVNAETGESKLNYAEGVER
jgi:hypothetical protein